MNKFSLPELPYAYNALEPHIDEETVKLHHDKHHLGYVNGANAALEALENARKNNDFKTIKAATRELAFHSSGAYLHELYWKMLNQPKNSKPEGKFLDQINKDFGSFDTFKAQMTAAAATAEASGWALLCWEHSTNQLVVTYAEVHQHASVRSSTPILACDVWEHAYYLKYQNKRPEYIENWWNLVDWKKVADYFEKIAE